MLLSSRLSAVKESPTNVINTEALRLKREGHNVISLGIGEPDFNTPDHVKYAAMEAIFNNQTRYTPVAGTVDLRTSIIKYLDNYQGLQYQNNEVTVGCGAKQVIYNALFATLNYSDEVILPAPYWVSYPDMVLLCGAKPIIATCPENTSFKLSPEILKTHITDQTKWVIINSPNNPTGAVYSADELRVLADVLLQYEHVNVISDDIYSTIIYDKKFVNIVNVEPKLKYRTLLVNGVSKSFAMTGWRVGYGAGDKKLIDAINVVQSQSSTHTSSISQAAAVAALDKDMSFAQTWNKTFKMRKDFLYDSINSIAGLQCIESDGAFYLFASCKFYIGKSINGAAINNDVDFAAELLKQYKVAIVPGSAFGIPDYFRVSYSISIEKIKEAVERIQKFCSLIN